MTRPVMMKCMSNDMSACKYGYTRFPCHSRYTGYARVAVYNGNKRSRVAHIHVLVRVPCYTINISIMCIVTMCELAECFRSRSLR